MRKFTLFCLNRINNALNVFGFVASRTNIKIKSENEFYPKFFICSIVSSQII